MSAEDKADLNVAKTHGINAWTLLRMQAFYQKRDRENAAINPPGYRNWKKLFRRLRAASWGFSNWLRSADFLVFSNSLENRPSGTGRIINKSFLDIYRLLGDYSIKYIEKPHPTHGALGQQEDPAPCSFGLIDFFAAVRMVFPIDLKIDREDALLALAESFDVAPANATKILKTFWCYVWVHRRLLRVFRPRAVFLTEGYSLGNMALIRACKENRIPSIEIQHGVANLSHPAYSMPVHLDRRDVVPDFFFAVSDRVRAELGTRSFIEPDRIVTIGSAHLERMINGANKDRSEGPVRVLVTLQNVSEARITEFVVNAARLDTEIEYLLLSRRSNFQPEIRLPENVKIVRDRNFYELVSQVDVHCTEYSTCALEAPLFSCPNVLINETGIARQYFGTALNGVLATYIVKPEEMSQAVRRSTTLSRDAITEASNTLLARNSADLTVRALRSILNISV